jgi:hypothetical protein
MPDDTLTATFEDSEVVAETDKALRVRMDPEYGGEMIWIPKSVVDDDSEVYRMGDKGDLILKRWWAVKEELIEP